MSVKTIDEGIRSQKAEALLKLIKKNPALPIIPLVDYEIVCDDSGRWLASFGEAYVGEYALMDERYYTEREEFKDNYYDRYDDELCERFNYFPWITDYAVTQGKYTKEQLKTNNESEKQLEEYLDKVADKYFIKAILVNIDLPDMVDMPKGGGE